MKSEKEFPGTLEDNIRTRGAMDKLVSDHAKSEISQQGVNLLQYYFIDWWQSESFIRIRTILPYLDEINKRMGRFWLRNSRLSVAPFSTFVMTGSDALSAVGSVRQPWRLCALNFEI